MLPWTDRAGRLSPLKLIVLIGTTLPFFWLAIRWNQDWLGSKPTTEAIHRSGDWAIRFLLLSLLVSPLRRIANWPKLIAVRRMLGLAALFYLILHFTLYNADQKWDLAKVASEIALRIYLTIGFVALLGMIALGATSFDAAIRRMGAANWNRLHMITYPVAVLGLLHFAMQSKLDATEALIMSGLFLLLMLYRILQKAGLAITTLSLAGLTVVSTVLTAAMEAGWYAATRGVDPWKILPANWQFDIGTRPAWWVLGAGAALVLIRLLRNKVFVPAQISGRSAKLAG